MQKIGNLSGKVCIPILFVAFLFCLAGCARREKQKQLAEELASKMKDGLSRYEQGERAALRLLGETNECSVTTQTVDRAFVMASIERIRSLVAEATEQIEACDAFVKHGQPLGDTSVDVAANLIAMKRMMWEYAERDEVLNIVQLELEELTASPERRDKIRLEKRGAEERLTALKGVPSRQSLKEE